MIDRLRISIVLVLAAATHPVTAQLQHSKWLFGFGAGLDFASPTPTPIPGNTINTDEGGASIADTNGNLLFYTNGESVRDRNHNEMPNGAGLWGSFSSAQSAIIVPVVGEDSLYYVFTTPAQVNYWGGGWNGLSYSVVDMRLNSGLGDVAVKNIQLIGSVTERLTAARHANGRDVWVICHGWDNSSFYAYLVDCIGIHGPIISNAGRSIHNDPGNSHMAAIGCMDVSPQGDRLATTWADINSAWSSAARIDIHTFNNANGTVSLLDTVSHTQTGLDARGYGVHFSPGGTKLYVSEYGLNNGMTFSRVLQYDMQAADIPASEYTVAAGSPEFGGLQAGPDGVMYVTRLSFQTYVSRIRYPELGGAACTFDGAGVSIAPGQNAWGLPNQWDTYPVPVQPELMAQSDTVVCGGSVLLDATVLPLFDAPEYLWSTGDATSSIVVHAPGSYSVEVVLSCDTLRDTIVVTLRGIAVDLGTDLQPCLGESVVLEKPEAAGQVLWSDGSSGPSMQVTTEGEHWITLTDTSGCVTSDTLHVSYSDCDCDAFVPNTFTPDGDEVNGTWAPVMECAIVSYDLSVFDRWGGLMCSSTDPRFQWDGATADDGVYQWMLSYTWQDGTILRHARVHGHILLLR
ncbi:MAG: gliding motility-associated C-terminal domain-containing protein [Flavobacteriales bacterium]